MLSALVIFILLFLVAPWGLIHLLTAGRTWTAAEQAPTREVGMVMGAATVDGRPSGYLRARLDLALDLWHQGKITVFIVSGSASDDEPAVMRKYLIENGVDSADIVEDTGGLSSYSSCVRAKQAYRIDELMVISQSYHVPRTVATCRMVGIDAVGVGDDQRPRNEAFHRYQRREFGANLKMIYDVVMKTNIGDVSYDPAVHYALDRHR